MGTHAVESCFHLLIHAFSLTIDLGVESGWHVAIGPQQTAELLPENGGKLGILIDATSTGSPWRRKTWSRTSSAVSLAEESLVRGIK